MREREREMRGQTFHTLPRNSHRYPIRFHSIMHQPPNGTEMIPEETFESDRIKGTYEDDSQE